MNERIKLLAEQANANELSYAYYRGEKRPENAVTLHSVDLEKFAELIVRECAHVAVFKDSGTVATADVAGHMAAGRSIAARLIKEHFGVEE